MKPVSRAALFAIIVFLVLAVGVPQLMNSQKSAPQGAVDGKRIFNQACAGCHDTLGTTSKPGPGLKSYYRRQPRPADASVRMLIQQGKGKMPPFSTFNKSQTDDLVAYLKTL